jgi:hypothetical protein
MGPQDPKDVTRDTARDLSGLVGELAALKGDPIHWLTDPEYAALRYRLEAAHAAAEAVASAWPSRALVCAEVYRIGGRMESAPTSNQAECERVYSAEYDEQGRYDIRRGAEGMPSVQRT